MFLLAVHNVADVRKMLVPVGEILHSFKLRRANLVLKDNIDNIDNIVS